MRRLQAIHVGLQEYNKGGSQGLAQNQPEQDRPFSVKWRVCPRHVYEAHLKLGLSGIPSILRDAHFEESHGTHSFSLSPFIVLIPILSSKFWLLKLVVQEMLPEVFIEKSVALRSGMQRAKKRSQFNGQDSSWEIYVSVSKIEL